MYIMTMYSAVRIPLVSNYAIYIRFIIIIIIIIIATHLGVVWVLMYENLPKYSCQQIWVVN